MGGTAKKIANVGGQALGTVVTGGLNQLPFHNNPFRRGGDVIGNALTLGTSGQNGLMPNPFGGNTSNPGVSGPFSADSSADQAAINSLGQKQYGDTLTAIDKNSTAQQQYATDTLNRMIPGIAENANAGGLFNSSAFPQEVARQASYLAQDVASQRAQERQSALSGLQGFQSGALQRGLSVEDFINQANVAKSIGGQMAPQPPSGKANFGTVASGVGALAPLARVVTGK